MANDFQMETVAGFYNHATFHISDACSYCNKLPIIKRSQPATSGDSSTSRHGQVYKIESKLSKVQNLKNSKMKLSSTLLGAIAVANADDHDGKLKSRDDLSGETG